MSTGNEPKKSKQIKMSDEKSDEILNALNREQKRRSIFVGLVDKIFGKKVQEIKGII